MNVFILGGGLQALSVARSLKEVGYDVFCLSSKNEAISHSKFVDKFIPSHVDISTTDYLKYICTLLIESQCEVIIPMSDSLAEFLSRNKREIEAKTITKCAIPSYDVFSIANDKWKLLQLCEVNGLPHPRTRALAQENLNEVARFVGFPALIKPNISVGARGITLVRDEMELKQKYQHIYGVFGECTLHEYIEQDGRPYYNVMIYRNAVGKIINYTILEIIRYYPIKGGSSSFGRTIENDELLTICVKTLEKLRWVGFADFDVLRTQTGEYKIIEINPRVPASLRAAAVSGINFPNIIVQDLTGNIIREYIYQPGKELRFLGLDIMWFLASSSRFQVKPSWFKFLGKNLYYQDGGYKDVKAMCFNGYSGIKKMFNSSFRRSKAGL